MSPLGLGFRVPPRPDSPFLRTGSGRGGVAERVSSRLGEPVIDLDVLISALLERADLVERLRLELSGGSGDLVTVARAAELRGVSPKTIRNWLSSNRLTRYGDPRTPLVDRNELMKTTAVPPPVRKRSSGRTFSERATDGR